MKRCSPVPNLWNWCRDQYTWFCPVFLSFFSGFFCQLTALLCFNIEKKFWLKCSRKKQKNPLFFISSHPAFFFYPNRKTTCTRKPCRLSSTPSPAPRRTILRSGPPPRLLTATSARVCCGASLGRVCAARSVGSKCTRSAKSFWTPTACRVSEALQYLNVGSNYQPQAKDGQGAISHPRPPNGKHYRWLSIVWFMDFSSQFQTDKSRLCICLAE